eukprot:366052-Chlamydomonas_euryale.AAC.5
MGPCEGGLRDWALRQAREHDETAETHRCQLKRKPHGCWRQRRTTGNALRRSLAVSRPRRGLHDLRCCVDAVALAAHAGLRGAGRKQVVRAERPAVCAQHAGAHQPQVQVRDADGCVTGAHRRRQEGQGTAEEVGNQDLRAKLEEKERKHIAKTKGVHSKVHFTLLACGGEEQWKRISIAWPACSRALVNHACGHSPSFPYMWPCVTHVAMRDTCDYACFRMPYSCKTSPVRLRLYASMQQCAYPHVGMHMTPPPPGAAMHKSPLQPCCIPPCSSVRILMSACT